MAGDNSTSVRSKWRLRCEALLPPPEPSSSRVRMAGLAASSVRRKISASSAYSAGLDSSGHQSAKSVYILGDSEVMG